MNNEAVLRELLQATLNSVPFSHGNEALQEQIVETLASIEQAPDAEQSAGAGQVPVACIKLPGKWVYFLSMEDEEQAEGFYIDEERARTFDTEPGFHPHVLLDIFAAPVAPREKIADLRDKLRAVRDKAEFPLRSELNEICDRLDVMACSVAPTVSDSPASDADGVLKEGESLNWQHVPRGFVIAPKEPTDIMAIAGANAQDYGCDDIYEDEAKIVYKAMLAAAPLPSQDKQEGM